MTLLVGACGVKLNEILKIPYMVSTLKKLSLCLMLLVTTLYPVVIEVVVDLPVDKLIAIDMLLPLFPCNLASTYDGHVTSI